MRLLLIFISFPAVLLAQGSHAPANLSSAGENSYSASKDSVNLTDASGRKQGHWIIRGGDVPNSGVGATDILEQGTYLNNERSGIWTRYGAKGEVRSVMRYVIDPQTKAAVRDQFYHYSYFPNGKVQRKPVIGECRSASDYSVYDEEGNLQEAEIFDRECNTTLKVQKIAKGELDSLDLFKPVYSFKTKSETASESLTALKNFGQNGEFCIDYLHRIFQVGTFRDGILTEGKEIEVDDMMRPQKVRYVAGGNIVRVAER